MKQNKTSQTVELLIKALKTERKLYPKIEICNTLSSLTDLAVKPLIACLGQIGINQHLSVPKKEFLKDSYPLPRDIAARTLINIGSVALPELVKVLEIVDEKVLSELIDAIGHINFNSSSMDIFFPLKACYERNQSEGFIKWKIIRAFSGVQESEMFLHELQIATEDQRLKREIERSLRLIEKRRH